MRKKILVLFFVLATVAVIPFAFAQLPFTGWTGYDHVTRVMAGYSGGTIYINGLDNVAGCNSSTIKFTSSNSNPDRIFKLALSAHITGKELNCLVQSCDGSYQKGIECCLKEDDPPGAPECIDWGDTCYPDDPFALQCCSGSRCVGYTSPTCQPI